MNVSIEFVEKQSDHSLPCIDIIADDPDSAFQLGELFQRVIGNKMCGWRIDGHGIRIPLMKSNKLGMVDMPNIKSSGPAKPAPDSVS